MMRVTCLKAPVAKGAGRIVEYLDPGERRAGLGAAGVAGPGSYYTDTTEPPGRWWGSGCEAVGMAGEVDPSHLRRMLEAEDPLTGRRLGRRFGDNSVRAYDATFSAPKSASLLLALREDDEVRREVVAGHDAAVEWTLTQFERWGCHTRRGTDGVFQVDAEGLVVALLRQHTSRSLDPQLHTHAVIWNKVQDPTGRWLALDARFLLQQQFTLSWLYDAALRAELDRRLGLAWDPLKPGHGQSDLTIVPEWVRDVFSQRSVQVEAKLDELVRRWMDEHGGAEPDARDLWQLSRRAAVTSRPPKQDAPADLVSEWRALAAEIGFQLPPITVRREEAALPDPELWDALDLDSIVDTALTRVSEQASTWIQADLAREIAVQIPPDVVYDSIDLLDVVEDLTVDALDRCVELHPPAEPGVAVRRDGRPVTEHVTKRSLTTPAILRQEARLLDWAERSIEPAPVVDPNDRADAVAAAVAGTGDLVVVVGPAGSGKTTVIAQGAQELAAQGRPVIGLAPSGKAADNLAEAVGAGTMTLASLLTAAHHGHRLPPDRATIILDEAGMASTVDLDRLVWLCMQHQWRLVAVGDPEQLPSVSRGGMFAHWATTLPAHRLEYIHRFREPWQAEASLALRRGDPKAARTYVDHGRVATAHPAVAAQHVARVHQRVLARGESLAITTSSAATARRINEEIQWLTHPHRADKTTSVALGDGTRAFVGDQVATRRNLPDTTDRGWRVRNRHTWTLLAVHPDGSITLGHPSHGTVTLPGPYVAEAVELGWAVTGYGNQAITEDHAICIVEPGSSRAGIYVGLTRGRDHNQALILDPTGTADPTDALTRAISRPPNALTAHATRDQLWREHDLEPPGRQSPAHTIGQLAQVPERAPVPPSNPARRPDRGSVLSI